MSLEFLSPGLFDVLVWVVVVIGVVLAVLRIRSDFRRGPRWPGDNNTTKERNKQP